MTFLGIFIAGCWGGFTLGILFAGAATIRSHRSGKSSGQHETPGYVSSGDFVPAMAGDRIQA